MQERAGRCRNEYLLTVVVPALEIIVRICVNICVLSTHVAITCPTNTTLTHTHKKERYVMMFYVNDEMRNSTTIHIHDPADFNKFSPHS